MKKTKSTGYMAVMAGLILNREFSVLVLFFFISTLIFETSATATNSPSIVTKKRSSEASKRAKKQSPRGAKSSTVLATREEENRFVVDWGTLKVRFYGKAMPSTSDENYKAIEKRAWAEGLGVAKKNALKFYTNQLSKIGIAADAASKKTAQNQVVRNTRSLRTEYYSSGTVKVLMESALAPILSRNDLKFKLAANLPMDSSVFSGLILRSDQKVRPRAAYEIVDETGRLLYSSVDVSQESFQKNLMGRWFEVPSRRQLSKAVGAKPVSLGYKVDELGRLVVQGSAWIEALAQSKAILENSKIAIVHK